MKEFNGYLINSKQALNFLNWYLKNPLQKQFKWAYEDNIVGKAKELINKIKHNPKMLFFGNQLLELVNTETTPNTTTANNGFNNGQTSDNGTSVKQYIKNLKSQTLLPYSKVAKIVKRVEIEKNKKAKKMNKKNNQPIIRLDNRCDEILKYFIKSYSNSGNTKLANMAKNFNYKKYLGIYMGTKKMYKPLLDKSTKLTPKRKKFNYRFLQCLFELGVNNVKQYMSSNRHYAYFKMYFYKSRLDIYEITAYLVAQKRCLTTRFGTVKLSVPHVPAFKSDVTSDNLNFDTHDNNTPKYLSDMNQVADYLRLQKHEI